MEACVCEYINFVNEHTGIPNKNNIKCNRPSSQDCREGQILLQNMWTILCSTGELIPMLSARKPFWRKLCEPATVDCSGQYMENLGSILMLPNERHKFQIICSSDQAIKQITLLTKVTVKSSVSKFMILRSPPTIPPTSLPLSFNQQ